MKTRSSTRLMGIGAVTAALLLGGAGRARASNESELATAENSYAALDYASALTTAEAVLARPGISHDVLSRATRVAGLASAALGKSESAKQYFTQLLEYEPTFKVDARLGPRFSEPFAEARGFWQAQGAKPGMDVTASIAFGQPGRIRFATHDPLNAVKRVSVAYRWAPAREYVVATSTPGEKDVETAANPKGSLRFEYYVTALDGNDRAIFEEGKADAPREVLVEVPRDVGATTQEHKSIFTSPVFWIATGTVVAAAAVSGYFLLRPTDYQSSGRGRGIIGANCGNMACD